MFFSCRALEMVSNKMLRKVIAMTTNRAFRVITDPHTHRSKIVVSTCRDPLSTLCGEPQPDKIKAAGEQTKPHSTPWRGFVVARLCKAPDSSGPATLTVHVSHANGDATQSVELKEGDWIVFSDNLPKHDQWKLSDTDFSGHYTVAGPAGAMLEFWKLRAGRIGNRTWRPAV